MAISTAIAADSPYGEKTVEGVKRQGYQCRGIFGGEGTIITLVHIRYVPHAVSHGRFSFPGRPGCTLIK